MQSQISLSKRSGRHGNTSLMNLSTSFQPNLASSLNIRPFQQTSSSSTREVRDSISPASNDLVGGRAASQSVNPTNSSNQLDQTLNPNTLRRYPDLYNETTTLLEIHPDHYGIFTGISSSMTFIPEKYVKKTRKIWNTRMQRCLDDGSEENWKKLLLLPIVLFDCKRNDSLNERKRSFGLKLESINIDDWSSFTIGLLSKKILKIDPLTQDEINKSATRLAEVGEIGKAFKKLKSDKNKIVPTEDFFLIFLIFII